MSGEEKIRGLDATATLSLPPAITCSLLLPKAAIRVIFRMPASNEEWPLIMKTPRGTESRTCSSHRFSFCLPTLLAVAASCGLAVLAEDGKAGSNTTAGAAIERDGVTNQAPAVSLSPGVREILKMADAGVSTEVIKAYVESTPATYQPTDVDVIALKKHNVADEVVTLLLKRGAEAQAAVAQAKNDALTRVIVTRKLASGGFDPESYDYFQYYYLQPRAQASVYQRLSPYYYPPLRTPYGYRMGYVYGPPFSRRPLYP